MWILLQFFNDYDQHGGYFAGVFESYDDAAASVHHLGRMGYEYSWYEVFEVAVGNLYDQECVECFVL